jgi:CDP-diacylglycerol--glycerol-3-phosphate 3-phosphatidyltransferase
MLYLQKGNFQKTVRWIGGKWMTANQATVAGCVFVILTAESLYLGLACHALRWLLLLVPLFLLLRMVMNTLDGMLSREHGNATVAGEIWNETLDIIGDTVCYGSLFFVPEGPRLSLFVFLILTWAAEFYGVLGKSMPNGIRRHETIGGGKPDRAVWMGLFAAAVFFYPSLFKYVDYYLMWVSLLVLLTCLLRVKKTIEAAKGAEYKSYTWIGR